MEENLYCPNCGKEAVIEEFDGQDIDETRYIIYCKSCDVKCKVGFGGMVD